MKYELLKSVSYQSTEEYERLYNSRFNSDIAVHIDLLIHGAPAFFLRTPDLYEQIIRINNLDRKARVMCEKLPSRAMSWFKKKCLIDEIVSTNGIEGVISTRKEISEILSERHGRSGNRFYNISGRYNMLADMHCRLKTCQDIRDIYNELLYSEIEQEDTENLPDGVIFRKNEVNVHSKTDKIIHRGVLPEEKIIEYMQKSLDFLNDDSISIFFRISVFHYLFGYIHPFYDGNGRTGRFISSYLLASETETPVIGYRLATTINENIEKYYKAFKICNEERNKGDLTPFVISFFDIIESAYTELIDELSSKNETLNYYIKRARVLPLAEDEKIRNVYVTLIQAALLSDNGIEITELAQMISASRSTAEKRLKMIDKNVLIINMVGKTKFYSADIDAVDRMINDLEGK